MTSTPDRYQPQDTGRNKHDLERAYWDFYWSTEQIADWLHITPETVLAAMDEYNIPRRTLKEAQTVRRMKDRGRDIEVISCKVTDPRVEETKPTSDTGGGVPWRDYS